MVKKVFCSLLVAMLVLFLAPAGFSVMKGLEDEQSNDVVKVGQPVEVPSGQQVDNAVAVGGPVTVRGHVKKDAVAVGGSVHLKKKSFVGGNAVAVGGAVNKEPGAVVKGDITEILIPEPIAKCSPLSRQYVLGMLALSEALVFIWSLILSIAMVAMFTPQMGRVSAEIEKKPVRNFFVGLLVALLVIPALLILAVSIIGIALIPLAILMLLAAGLLAYFAASHLVGKRLLHVCKVYGKSMIVETMTGIILLFLLGMIPLVGPAIKTIALLCGLGAVYQTRFGTK